MISVTMLRRGVPREVLWEDVMPAVPRVGECVFLGRAQAGMYVYSVSYELVDDVWRARVVLK